MVKGLKIWWDKLSELGPGFGYFPEATKSWIIVKEEYEDLAREISYVEEKIYKLIQSKSKSYQESQKLSRKLHIHASFQA